MSPEEQMKVEQNVEPTISVLDEVGEPSPPESQDTTQDMQRGGELESILPTEPKVRGKKYASLQA